MRCLDTVEKDEEKDDLTTTVAKSAKVIVDLQAWLRELDLIVSNLQSRLKEFELEVAKEKETNMELEKELLMFKKEEAMEQHEKEVQKTVRQARFFIEGLDLGFFDPFKDMKDGELLDEEEVVATEEDVG